MAIATTGSRCPLCRAWCTGVLYTADETSSQVSLRHYIASTPEDIKTLVTICHSGGREWRAHLQLRGAAAPAARHYLQGRHAVLCPAAARNCLLSAAELTHRLFGSEFGDARVG